MERRITTLLIVFLFILNVIPINTSSSDTQMEPLDASNTEFEFIPLADNILFNETNQTIDISLFINIQTNTTIDTVGTDLIHFSPSVLHCKDITWGNLFDNALIRIDGAIDNDSGTISNMIWGSIIPTDISGYYANFTFEVVGRGYGYVKLDMDPSKTGVAFEGEPLPWIVSNYSITSGAILISNEYPTNHSINMPHNLLLSVDLLHTLGEHMDMTWKSNATGIWKTIGIDENLPNGTYDMSCYGVIESPYNQHLTYSCTDYSSGKFHNNTCPGRKLGYITKVEIYTPSFSGQITPIFAGTITGQTYTVPTSKYTDITTDTSAPTQWQWDDIVNLDVNKSSSSPTYIYLTYDMGFGDNTLIFWSVNVTDGVTWRNETYWYYTELTSPIISNPHPYDSQTWLTYYPTLYADIIDPNGDNMTVSFFYQNDTGSWIQIGTSQHGYNDTYSQLTALATYNKTFFWRVLADDGNNHTGNRTFRFTFRERQVAPMDFTAHTVCDEEVNLTWIKPDYVDNVRIQRRPDHYPTSIFDGLDIYNGTGEQVYDTAVLPGTTYYYRAWSWNNTDKTWSIANSSATEITAPSEVTGFNVTATSYSSTNITWTKGVGALSTLIRRKIGSYPTNQSDGALVYEGNGTSYNDTGLGSNTTYYYRAWAHYLSGIYIPMYQNPDPMTGVDIISAQPSTYDTETFTIRSGQSFTATSMSLPLWTSRDRYVYADVYFYHNGPTYSKLRLFPEPGGWQNFSFGSGYFMKAGEVCTILVRAGVTTHQLGSPHISWGVNDTNPDYYHQFKIFGYYGYYSCLSTDDTAKTFVGPPLVNTQDASLILNLTARLNAYLVADGGESSTVGFLWENESGSQNTTIGAYPLNTSYLLNITGLLKGHTYAFQAWARNTYGYNFGEEYLFSTRPGEPTNFTESDTTHNSTNLSWTKGLGADYTSIRMKTGSYPADPTDGFFAGYTNGTWALVENLDANVTYYFRAWSYNTSNSLYSTLSAEKTVTTLVTAPVINATGVTAINSTGATLNSLLVDDGGQASTCGFRWGTSSGVYTHNVTVGSFTIGTTQLLQLANLTIGTMYYYQAWSKNYGGFYNDTEEKFATRPVAPISFTANNYGARQINITWTKGSGADATKIQRRVGAYPTSITNGTTIYNGTASAYLNVLLTENTHYYYRAWSYNSTNLFYSTLNASSNDITGWLPNVTYMNPCGDTNVDRPTVNLTMSGTGTSPLTYGWYAVIGDSNRRLGDWASGEQWGGYSPPPYSYGWFNVNNCLSYDPAVAYVHTYTWASFQASSSPLTIGLNEPTMVTGVNLSYVEGYHKFPIGEEYHFETFVRYHDYYADEWHEVSIESNVSFTYPDEFLFTEPTIIDEINVEWTFDWHAIHQHFLELDVDWVAFYKIPDELHNTTATSGQLKSYNWPNATKEGYNYWWMASVSDGIDTVYDFCDFTTEGVELTNENPVQGSTVFNYPSHQCSIQVNHTGGDTMDVHFYYKNITSGLYVAGGQNLTVGNGTYSFIYPNSNQFGETYYWLPCVWDGLDWHNETFNFSVREPFTPSAPIFNLSNNGTHGINITDIAPGDSYTNSIMMRYKIGAYPTDINDGTLLFNGTDIQYQHTGLDPNTNYCYRAWSYNITDSLWGAPQSHSLVTLGPGLPAFTLARFNSTVINITGISKNAYSTTVLIRAKIGSYPTSITDGSFVCNTTGASFNHTGLTPASDYYYSAWAYDAPDHWWSSPPTQHHQKTNGPSYLSSSYPNGIKISGINPQLSIVIDEYNDEDDINVYFKSNYTGPWTTINSQLGVYQGTKTYQTTQFIYQDYRYWWSINVTDGELWTNATYTFETGSMAVPTVTATTINTSKIHLNWTIAPGTTHTYIERKIDSYPTNRTDGIMVYNGTGNNTDDIGISPGQLCRYKVWSYNATFGIYSSGNTTAQALTKPVGPSNLVATKVDYQTINLTWTNGTGSQRTVIIYKPDEYPTSHSDGTVVYNGTLLTCSATNLKPDDFLNFFTPNPGTDNFGVYIGGGDPFNNSCDSNTNTKWDLNRTKTGNFSYVLGIENQRVKGFSILFKDFYGEPGVDWNAAITKFEVYNGTWHTDWTGEKYNSGTEKEWWNYTSSTVYKNVSEVRFSAWTEFITPDLYEVRVGKLGYVHCFKAWGYVSKGGLSQYSDGYSEASNKTEDTPPNIVPYITLNSPGNGSTGWNRNPLLNITIADQEGQQMNISWQYLHNGNWTEMHLTTLVNNGTYAYIPSVFNNLSTWYHWRVNVSDTADVQYSAIYMNYNISSNWSFKIRDQVMPNRPNDFNATTHGAHAINMTWTLGTYADRTYIERNTTSTWTRGNGVSRFNGTGTFFQDTGLNSNTTYYYEAWGYNSSDSTWSVLYASDNATTEYSANDAPNQPYNPSPANNTAYINVYNLWMNCTVSDPNGDTLAVHYYWGNGSYIGTITGVANNSTSHLFLSTYWHRHILTYNVTWVTHDTTHYWYAVADDGEFNTSSATWNFHTYRAWDFDCNRRTNYLDLSSLVGHYGLRDYPPGADPWDIDENTYTNYLDLSSLVGHYGQIY